MDLKASNITFGNDYTIHNNGKLTHIVPIKKINNISMYFTTPELSQHDLLCIHYKKPYDVYRAKIVTDSLNRVNNNSEILINQLNKFKDDIVNKLKYITKLPNYENQIDYSFKINKNNTTIPNILQYNNKSINISYNILKNIIKHTKYKLLIHIQSLSITHNNVYLNLRISRIIIDSFDSLNTSDKVYINNIINSNSINNNNKIIELNRVYIKNYKSIKSIKHDLYKLL